MLIKNLFLQKHLQSKRGFSLVEMMVAMSLFSVVSIIVLGSILVLINGNRQNQIEQNTMSSLTMVLDTMSRDIRTGMDYYCRNDVESNNFSTTRDCVTGAYGFSFREVIPRLTAPSGISGDRVAFYRYEHNNGRGEIRRRAGENGERQAITPAQLDILELRFFTIATEPLVGPVDTYQPAVTIIIRAREVGQTSDEVILLQTTVTQRILDI